METLLVTFYMETLLVTFYMETLLVRELMGAPPPPPRGISETYISKNPIPLAVQINLSACTHIAGAFALESQLKVATSLILGVGVTLSKIGVGVKKVPQNHAQITNGAHFCFIKQIRGCL